MKNLLLTLMLAYSALTFAQKFSQTINDQVISTLNATKAGATVNSLTENYIIEALKKEDDYFEITLKSSNDKQESFTLKPLTFVLFNSKFQKHFTKLIQSAEGITVTSAEYSEPLLSFVFAQLITFERTEDERPVVAYITIKDDIPVSFKKKGQSSQFVTKVSDARLELTFYNGFIEKVELEATVEGKKIRFANLYSIGISSSNGIREFQDHNIFSFYYYNYDPSKSPSLDRIHRDNDGAGYLKINFADIIDYDREIDINANDISPEPTKLNLEQDIEVQKVAKLYKEESTKLFEAVVFSDFLGVFDEENPNGIIQTEVSKKFFINTDRHQVSLSDKWFAFLFPPIVFSEGYGFFEYIDLSAQLSKIEENNKYLSPSTIIDDSGNTVNFYEPLRIMQHQSFSIGADINILYLENQNNKIDTNLDLGFRYGRSGLQLNETEEEFFNTLTISSMLQFKIVPEKRYGFAVSNRVSYFEIYNDDNLNLLSISNNNLTESKHWFNTTRLEFFVNTSSTGKLFMRYNFITELEDWDNNFSQFQFGYSFFLLKQNGKLK